MPEIDSDPNSVGNLTTANARLSRRVRVLEEAIRKATSLDTGGYAWWDGEGNVKIESEGHTLLKKVLEDK